MHRTPGHMPGHPRSIEGNMTEVQTLGFMGSDSLAGWSGPGKNKNGNLEARWLVWVLRAGHWKWAESDDICVLWAHRRASTWRRRSFIGQVNPPVAVGHPLSQHPDASSKGWV